MDKSKNGISIFNLVFSIFMWIIATIWICIIFVLATETQFESYARSDNILMLIKQFCGLELNQLIIRKFAHIVEYGFLCFVIYMGLAYTNGISVKHSFGANPKKTIRHANELNIIYTFWLSTFVSILDEYIQLFIEGREASIVDIFIDSGSIITMLLIVRIMFLLKLVILRKKEEDFD